MLQLIKLRSCLFATNDAFFFVQNFFLPKSHCVLSYRNHERTCYYIASREALKNKGHETRSHSERSRNSSLPQEVRLTLWSHTPVSKCCKPQNNVRNYLRLQEGSLGFMFTCVGVVTANIYTCHYLCSHFNKLASESYSQQQQQQPSGSSLNTLSQHKAMTNEKLRVVKLSFNHSDKHAFRNANRLWRFTALHCLLRGNLCSNHREGEKGWLGSAARTLFSSVASKCLF